MSISKSVVNLYKYFIFFIFSLIVLIMTIVMEFTLLLLTVCFTSKEVKTKWKWFCIRFTSKILNGIYGIKIKLSGIDLIPKTENEMGKIVLISNHTSLFDISESFVNIPLRISFLAKKSLSKIPLLNIFMKHSNCLFVDRSNPRNNIKAMRECISNINNEIPTFIFPEGTRSTDGNIASFKKGAVKIILKTDPLIIPIAISGLREYFENRKKIFYNKKAHMSILKPFRISDLESADEDVLSLYLQNIIQKEVERQKALNI